MKEVEVVVTVYFNEDRSVSAAEWKALEVVAHLLQSDIPYVTQENVNSFLVATPDGTLTRSVP